MRVKVHVWKTILTKDHSDSGAQDELGEIVKWLLLRLCCVPCLFCPFLWGNGTLLFRAFNPISKQFRVYVNYSLSQEVRSLSTCASKCWQSISFSPVNILSCILVFFPLTCDILFLDQCLENCDSYWRMLKNLYWSIIDVQKIAHYLKCTNGYFGIYITITAIKVMNIYTIPGCFFMRHF